MDKKGGNKEKMRKFPILSLFPLHFLILSPFSHSQAGRLAQLVQPCVKLNCLYTTPQILKTLPFIDVILVFFFPTNIDWSERSTTLFFLYNVTDSFKNGKKIKVNHPRIWATLFLSWMVVHLDLILETHFFVTCEKSFWKLHHKYCSFANIHKSFFSSGKQYSSCSRSGGRMNTGWSIDSSQVRRSLPPPFIHYFEYCWQ